MEVDEPVADEPPDDGDVEGELRDVVAPRLVESHIGACGGAHKGVRAAASAGDRVPFTSERRRSRLQRPTSSRTT
ncbi:hypothetical protein GCM10009017_13480 [Halarchaeum rubridurum]|uniref:Uncharacterized protein n=1 Tax=Halarchaeum rubridurum TaxID=489911 RepID=A0A830FYW2_9EURY|nr:hypothetical protein GCM10009017_13480 [Halarchaeum rubridurum]